MSRQDDDVERKKELAQHASPDSRLLDLFEKVIEGIEKVDEESRQRDGEQQRQIDFILEQQAQFAAGMEQLREAQAQAEERWKRTEEKWDRMWERTNGQINAVLAIAEMQTQEINGLAKAQAQSVESQANTDRQMAETTEKLNALIDVVGQLINERRNGG